MNAPARTRDQETGPTVVGLTSASAGSGRTGAITNVGWILASAGKRVLVVDWGTERPQVHDYLRPFYLTDSPNDDLRDHQHDMFPGIGDASAGPVNLREYAIPAGLRRIHVLGGQAVETAGAEPGATELLTARQLVLRWKRLRELPYDYVLIDLPTNPTAEGHSHIAELCDVAVVCFVPRRAAIKEARAIAYALAGATLRGIRVLPVLTQFDDSDEERAQTSRNLARNMFRELPAQDADEQTPSTLELPYHPHYEYDEALAVLVDEPGQTTTLLAGYERLTAAITKGEVTSLVPPPAATRDRYRRRLDLSAPDAAVEIMIAYAAPDRRWADWVRQRLERAGATVTLMSPSTPDGEAAVSSLVVISSPYLLDSPAAAWVARIVETPLAGGAPVDVVRIRVPDDEELLGSADTGSSWATAGTDVTVALRPEVEIGGQLLAHFGLFDEPGTTGWEPVRFPGEHSLPDTTNLPPRNRAFVGRHDDLEELRDRITAPENQGRWTLAGPACVGKSEIAKEYAHRFGYDYDLVWWIPVHAALAARASILQLGELKLPSEAGDVREVLDAVSAGSVFSRALLIYDNVDTPEAIAGMLPEQRSGGSVHVLVTARDTMAVPDADPIAVPKFDLSQSRALLRREVPGLSIMDAERMAEVVENGPLAVGLAAALLRESAAGSRAEGATLEQSAALATATFLERFGKRDLGDMPDALAVGLQPVVARVLSVILSTLLETPSGRLVVRLAQFCAFLSPEGADLSLLRSAAVLARLHEQVGDEGSALRIDAGELDRTLWIGSRYGLFHVEWGQPAALVMHPVLQALFRSPLVPEAQRLATKTWVLSSLAAYAPNEAVPESAETRTKFNELQKHLFTSGALQANDGSVRRWLVNHSRHIYRNGDTATWQYAIDVASEVAARWRAFFGAEDQLLLRLEGQLANLHRALGQFEQAREIDEAVLATQQRTLGLRHRQTLITTRGKAADLRSLGRYEEAYAEDHEAWTGFRAILGDDHEHTRMAANNLAISAFLMGDVGSALKTQQDLHLRLARLFGQRHPATWMSAASVGVYLREWGDYPAAEERLKDALDRIFEVHGHRLTHPDVLWIGWQLAVTWRRNRNVLRAKERSERTAKIYREQYGDNHPNTLGCTLSCAADHHALGDSSTAVDLALRCLYGYQDITPDHPFSAICQMNLALYLRAINHLSDAFDHSAAALTFLRDRLGESHPWTLVATVNHASTLALRGDVPAAVELAEPADEACRELLRKKHPCTTMSGHNLARMHDLLSPETVEASSRRWGEMDIDVLPN